MRLLTILCFAASVASADVPLNAILLGGGPDRSSNAAQIAGHVQFVASLLPSGTRRRLLFASGKEDDANVAYSDNSPAADARAALGALLPDARIEAPVIMEKPKLGTPLDGPSNREAFRRALTVSAPKENAPLLLYFAGHGSQDGDRDQDTFYAMWRDEQLTVKDLAAEIARLPANSNAPIVLVMAQCYSGAFANILFREGDPNGDQIPRNLVGFFSATKDRTAAGCGTGTGATDYQDFSSYFFGAICGHDRFGKAIAESHGSVTLHEAFCYALGHDESSDTPVCTSDAFLRRFAPLDDEKVFDEPYSTIHDSADAAQQAALDLLSEKLKLDGEQRALEVYDRINFEDPVGRSEQIAADHDAAEAFSAVRAEVLADFFRQWPKLRWNKEAALDKAAHRLSADEPLRRRVLSAADARDQADETLDDEEALLVRFANLYQSVALARHLRENGPAPVKARFERLWQAEQRVLPLHP